MKIAYLLSGHARVYQHTSHLLEKRLLKTLKKKSQVDVFISTWKMTDRGGCPEWKTSPEAELRKYYPSLARVEIELNWSYTNRYVSDFYKRWKVWSLMVEEEQRTGEAYDIVFRDRMDSCHVREFPAEELDDLGDKVHFPIFVGDYKFRPFVDWIAFGTRDAMFDYFNIFNLIKDASYEDNVAGLINEKLSNYYPEQVLYAGLKSRERETKFSSYEIQPYDRYFGVKVHDIEVHSDDKGEFRLTTRRYGGVVPDVPERENYDKPEDL